MAKFLDENGVLYLWGKIKSFFVQKEDGKGLSSNDFTSAEKTKLAGITAGATKVTVDEALSSTSTNPVQNKAVNTALGNKVDKVSGKQLSTNDYTTAEKNKLAAFGEASTYALKSDITGMYKYKGSVATVDKLPANGNTLGDVWDVQSTGMNYAWNGSAWDALGQLFSITPISNAEIDAITG